MPASPRRPSLAALYKGDAGAVGALVVIFFGANWSVLVGRSTEHWDAEDFFAPFFALVARLARHGHLLLWNPFSGGGSPDFAEPQVGAFSPITLLFGLVAGSGPLAFHLYWLCLWLFGGLGMYVLARALGAPPWGALITSLGLVFSGFALGQSEHTSVVYSFAFVPWIVWRVRAAMTTGRVWPAVEAGALWGLSALAGNPAIVIPAGLFIATIALAWLPPAGPGASFSKQARTYAVLMVVVVVVGVAILAPTYLSFRHEVAGFSDRSLPVPRDVAMPKTGLGFNWLLNLASPMIAIGTYQSPGWPTLDICYLPLYFGAALPTLALFTLWQRRRGWWAWAVAGAGLLFLGVALGSTLPLRAWLYDLLPPTRFIRHPPMFRGFFTLTVAMLAAVGTGIIEERRRAGWSGLALRPLAVAAGIGATVSVAAYAWVLSTLPSVRGEPLLPIASLHLALAWVGLAAVCLAAVRRAGMRRWLPGALVVLAALDLVGAFTLTISVVYRPINAPLVLRPAPAGELLDLGPTGFARIAYAHANRNLYAQQPALLSYTAMTNPIRTRWEQDGLLVGKAVGPQRVWFAETVPTVPPTPEAFAAFQHRVHEVNGLVILRHERTALLQSQPDVLVEGSLAAILTAPPAVPVGGRVIRYRADDLALRVTCPHAGFLLLTDRWSRSWTARVNGQSVPVDGGDFLFRLVPVVAGENLVEMRFEPPGVFPMLALSWMTLLAVAIGSVWQIVRRRKKIPVPAFSGTRPALLEPAVCAVF